MTLGIKDKNIQFKDKVEIKTMRGIDSLFYFGKLSYTPQRCELCVFKNQNYSIIKNGTKKFRITLPKVSERPAYLLLEKQRFHCKNCHSYYASWNFLQIHKQISLRILKGQPYKQIEKNEKSS